MEFRDINGNVIKISKKDKAQTVWRPSVYGLLIRDGSMLCVKQRWSYKYSLPGGGMELGEDISDSLKREFLEETGYTIKPAKRQPIYFNTALFISPESRHMYHAIALYYEVRLSSGRRQKIKDLGERKEIQEICWKDLSRVKPKDFSYFHRDFIKLLLSK